MLVWQKLSRRAGAQTDKPKGHGRSTARNFNLTCETLRYTNELPLNRLTANSLANSCPVRPREFQRPEARILFLSLSLVPYISLHSTGQSPETFNSISEYSQYVWLPVHLTVSLSRKVSRQLKATGRSHRFPADRSIYRSREINYKLTRFFDLAFARYALLYILLPFSLLVILISDRENCSSSRVSTINPPCAGNWFAEHNERPNRM